MTTAKRGRPKLTADEQKVRSDLLAAAQDSFLNKPYKDVTIRELADKANTNSAMINYYFGGKDGLLSELLEKLLTPIFDELTEIGDLESYSPTERSKFLFTHFINFNKNNPWFAKLLVNDMTNSDPKLRHVLLESLAKKSANLFPLFIEQQKTEGYFDVDIDSRFTMVSLLSLFAFPILAAPILRDAYDFDINEVDIDLWIDHSVRVFERGVTSQSVTDTTDQQRD